MWCAVASVVLGRKGSDQLCPTTAVSAWLLADCELLTLPFSEVWVSVMFGCLGGLCWCGCTTCAALRVLISDYPPATPPSPYSLLPPQLWFYHFLLRGGGSQCLPQGMSCTCRFPAFLLEGVNFSAIGCAPTYVEGLGACPPSNIWLLIGGSVWWWCGWGVGIY